MSDAESLRSAFEDFAREQKVRDEGLRRAFTLLIDAMRRSQAVLDEVHQAATREPPASKVPALLAEIKQLLEAQPAALAAVIDQALTRRRG